MTEAAPGPAPSGTKGTPPKKRVALYGGSFDPPHRVHALIAGWLAATGSFDEVRLIPVAGHAFSKRLAPFEHRRAMVALATAHLGPAVVVDPIESTLGTPSYTINTITALKLREPDVDWTVIMGSDSWAGRRRWRRWSELRDAVAFLIFGREATPGAAPSGRAGDEALADATSGPTTNTVTWAPISFPDVSSTATRAALKAGAPTDALLLPSVAAYITDHDLYAE